MTGEASRPETRLGDVTPADRPRVGDILRATGHFRPEEIDTALEVFDSAFGLGVRRDPDYRWVGMRDAAGLLVGFACYGPTPLADRTWDLYWIAVEPGVQGGGAGSMLIKEVERRVADERARLMLIETGGREEYRGTRRFYERLGYAEQARLRDFYAPGDDRVTLTKRFDDRAAPGA
jgi:D-alanine-D-alanine ligase